MLLQNEGPRSCNALSDTGTEGVVRDPKSPTKRERTSTRAPHALAAALASTADGVGCSELQPEVLEKTFDDDVASHSKERPFVRREIRILLCRQFPLCGGLCVDNFKSALVAPVLRCVEVDLEIEHVSYTDGKPVPSVIAAGDVPGGVHGANLDSSSLLDRGLLQVLHGASTHVRTSRRSVAAHPLETKV